jgi:hypothetical protein
MTEIPIPKYVFIVPYRNRPQHKFFFCKYMSYILEDTSDYEIYFSHQCDARTFNRGAIKNIGFMAVKAKYPDHYKGMNFIFNDVDTMPFTKIFNYAATEGSVKHFYGFKHALGGIVAMKGSDFEKINGFPGYWGWGMEDNVLQKRCDAAKLIIDRSVFYPIGSPQILQLFDGMSRIISKKDPWRMEHDNKIDGLQTIKNLTYSIDTKSDDFNDNIFIVPNQHIFVINVTTFDCHIPFNITDFMNYDLREPPRQIIQPNHVKNNKSVDITKADDWTNIPDYHPTNHKKVHFEPHVYSPRHAVAKPRAQASANIRMGGVVIKNQRLIHT